MNIKIIKGIVFIKDAGFQDMGLAEGWHKAGIIKDAIANWPQYADEIRSAIPAYEAAEAEAERQKLAEEARLTTLAEAEETKRLEQAEKQKLADAVELQKKIDDAVKAALKSKGVE